MASSTCTTTVADTAAEAEAEAEAKTYWCHECDMSVSLMRAPSPLLCPHCHTHFLELMDSLSQNDAAESESESPLLDVVFQDALLLLSPKNLSTKKKTIPIPPSIPVTPTLLSSLDPNAVVLCAVCKDQIALHAHAKQLPCNHLYHADCITPWLQLHASCPLCRFRLEEEEEDEGDDGVMTEIRRELIARLTELTEEDFYGLRTTLSHIASRHARIEENENHHRAQIGEPQGGESAC